MTMDPAAMPPTLSVICVFYNAADYLSEAIESVLAQDFADFELLLVDDGSTDGSDGIARAFAENNPDKVRCLAHPATVNRGISASRNLGLAQARADIVAFIDADDRWTSGKLREQLAIFERFPALDAVCGTVRYWRSWAGGEDEMIRSGHAQDRVIHPPEALLRMYPLGTAAAPCPSDLMLRRAKVLALGGFEEAFPTMYEDQAFLAKLYLEGTIYCAGSHWLDYRLHDESCMARAISEGRYPEVRERFLRWFAGYVRSRPNPPLRVRLAIEKALLRYRLPRLVRLLRPAAHHLRRFRT